ncbi:hypothetical protein JCM9140_1249 [Halalkalibacter wakoensis JCM 9140]|uniref:Uncharacterized protein n=1 Tax=Halalkalibacter wakoensis JCM 9140 TaxID=1236970 RepID=W4PZV0_9BACI|nr:hypothetical protein [Halalkalibacter wakoensis]GAE25267.1 hypothetical protein JCM9140_1249 [Halalkalibacter wakoensis JCM 9140]
MEKTEKLKAFAKEMKEGFQLVKEKKDHEALKKLQPFVELMRRSGAPHIRLFATYSIAQIRTGELEGFLETYAEVKEMEAKSDEELKLKEQLDGFFNDLMNELQKEDGQPQ